MILFFVGIIEMVISASWTKAVSKASVGYTGAITTVNILIWYYVIRVVVENLDNWFAIIPYTAGCVIGSMLGAVGMKKVYKSVVKAFRPTKRFGKVQPSAKLVEAATTIE
jgi:hypothetical protein